MEFVATTLPGVWLVEMDRLGDERGWFARTFDAAGFREHGLDPAVAQCSASYSPLRDTLRGMHYQVEPDAESKLVRCVRGAVFDVAVDLRADSPTCHGWYGVELTEENGRALYIPKGLAHGFQTLVDGCEMLYQMSDHHVPEAARGVRWDDPAFSIEWPEAHGPRVISARDSSYPDVT
jgi:dTDP-4-dehydrorhamnose 3,5-epimerase